MTRWSDPQPDSRFTVADGMRIHYKRAGSGPAMVLLHGAASSLHQFGKLSDLLQDRLDIVCPDLPGFGLTGPRADRDYRIAAYAATIASFMQALGISTYGVAGNSLGGNIAWNLALDRPDLVTSLVLVNATGYPEKTVPAGIRLARNPLLRPVLRKVMPRRAIEGALRAAAGPGSRIVDETMVDRACQLMNRPGNRNAYVDFVNTPQSDRSTQIPGITAPALVLRSTGIDGQHFARDIPGAREMVHPGGSHLLPEEDPEWVAAAVLEFLTSGPGMAERPRGGWL